MEVGIVLGGGLVLHRWPVIRDEETSAEQQLGPVTDAQVCKDQDGDENYEDHDEDDHEEEVNTRKIMRIMMRMVLRMRCTQGGKTTSSLVMMWFCLLVCIFSQQCENKMLYLL